MNKLLAATSLIASALISGCASNTQWVNADGSALTPAEVSQAKNNCGYYALVPATRENNNTIKPLLSHASHATNQDIVQHSKDRQHKSRQMNKSLNIRGNIERSQQSFYCMRAKGFEKAEIEDLN